MIFYNNTVGPVDETASKALTLVRNNLAPYAEEIADIIDQGRMAVLDDNFLDNPNDIDQYADHLLTMSNLFRKNPMKGLKYLGTLWSEIQEMTIGEVRDQLKIDLGQLYNQAFPNTGRSFEEGAIAPEHNKAKKSDIPAYARKAAGKGPLSLDDLRAEKLRNISHRDTLAKNRGATDEGNACTGALKSTPKGGKFKVGDKEFTDTSSLEEIGMTPKQKSFAKLAPPVDKITFADKIAGAKKEVDEMLGDVAAEAMKAALGKGKKVVADEDYGPMEGFGEYEPDELEVGKSKKSSSGGTITKTKTGIVHIGRDRTDDPDTTAAPGEKRGRGRPKSTGGPRQERVTANSRKADRTTHGQAGFKKASKVKEGDIDPADRGEYDREGDMAKNDIKTIVRHAQALHKVLGDDDNLPEWVQSKLAKIEGMMIAVDEYMQNNNDGGEEAIAEKAVSKKQQKFMGMVHAAQKGGKPASKEVGKVAKSMGKKDAEDFASTKHKGLPEKAKSKKKEEEVEESSTTAGSVAPSTAKAGKGGMTFGKGIYDSFNRDVEAMISESMNISMSVNSDEHGGPRQTLTINATDDDAIKLGALLKAAGLGGGEASGSCGCGSTPCSCARLTFFTPSPRCCWLLR